MRWVDADDLVSLLEVSQRWEMSLSGVGNLRTRYETFPAPVIEKPKIRLYSWTEMEQWREHLRDLERRGKKRRHEQPGSRQAQSRRESVVDLEPGVQVYFLKVTNQMRADVWVRRGEEEYVVGELVRLTERGETLPAWALLDLSDTVVGAGPSRPALLRRYGAGLAHQDA